ncbi:LysR family transcriptional regulator [Hyalangium sp.]|uniref:LysR family transcriptional regulator n=1 Tax=Hyalangium sp. TaxID=2028555 RepID=UPI002D385D4B|nr:LysR family transcriptional regulator [Hyalangium sp.]HYH97056.1 LysR family transcriptional regulator [Hyalangium sp.]
MLDWDDLRIFLAVARCGSLSAAARELKVSQPTVGRRIQAFERRLGARLFRRTPGGYALSAVGETVRSHAERMEQDALALERAATGRDAGLEGPMRITASEWLAVRVLGPALVPFMKQHPAITLEIVADVRWLSLPKSEADIAFRPAAFTHREVFQRKVARIAFGLYASGEYLAQHGVPDFQNACSGHSLIAMSNGQTPIADLPWLAKIASKARVVARSNGREAQAAMAAEGGGIACLPRLLGDSTPNLRLLAPPTPPPERTLWLGVHRETRTVPRVRALIAFATRMFQSLAPRLNPDG